MRKLDIIVTWTMLISVVGLAIIQPVVPLQLMYLIPVGYWIKVGLEDYHDLHMFKAFVVTYIVMLVDDLISGEWWMIGIHVLLLALFVLATYKELEKSKRRIYFRSS